MFHTGRYLGQRLSSQHHTCRSSRQRTAEVNKVGVHVPSQRTRRLLFFSPVWQVTSCTNDKMVPGFFFFWFHTQSLLKGKALESNGLLFQKLTREAKSIKQWLPPWHLPTSGLCSCPLLWKCKTKCFCGKAGRRWPPRLPPAGQSTSLWNPTEVNFLTLPSPLVRGRCKAPCLLEGTKVSSSSFCSSCCAADCR